MQMTSFLDLTPTTETWTHFFIPRDAEILEVLYTETLPEYTEDLTGFKYVVDANGDPTFIDDFALMDMWLARGGDTEDPLLLDTVQVFTDVHGNSFQFYKVGTILITGGSGANAAVSIVPPPVNDYLVRHAEQTPLN